ncbi:MAG: hypothetical protein RXR08_11655 [Sulfolobaceae archaeon]|uniref:hypothetical protein n=1 Tax=Acidianus hospitalis TaxID=563177 RepID=UPI001FE1386F|nr:hypothetical protein [Acidianus hospitalis]
MKKWILSFLILLLLMPAIPTLAECNAHYKIIGGGGGPPGVLTPSQRPSRLQAL